VPLRFEANRFTESDFELPGLPIIRMGILFMRQTNAVKVFYFKAEFIAILSAFFKFLANYD
jgi:hypothetical protein